MSRQKCPKCGSLNVKEVDDKSKVVAYFNHKPIYRQKLVCRECTHEWFPEEKE